METYKILTGRERLNTQRSSRCRPKRIDSNVARTAGLGKDSSEPNKTPGSAPAEHVTEAHIYRHRDAGIKRRGSTFVIITLDNLDRF